MKYYHLLAGLAFIVLGIFIIFSPPDELKNIGIPPEFIGGILVAWGGVRIFRGYRTHQNERANDAETDEE